MHADVLIVQVCKFLDDGNGMYRLQEPCRFLAGLPGVVAIDCHYAHRHLPRVRRRLGLPFALPHDFCYRRRVVASPKCYRPKPKDCEVQATAYRKLDLSHCGQADLEK